MADREFVSTLAAAKRGDDLAFATLFRQTQPAVLRYLQVVAGGRAEDLAGETWLQVVRGLGRFKATEPAAFRGWVLSIARHRWMDDQRARSRRPEVVAAVLPEEPGRLDVASEVEQVVTTERAVRLIGRLPADQAEVVALRYIVDLD